MLIKVIYKDGRAGHVKSSELGEVLAKNEIVSFCRAEGWVSTDQDPTRKVQQPFSGNKKRQTDFTDCYE